MRLWGSCIYPLVTGRKEGIIMELLRFTLSYEARFWDMMDMEFRIGLVLWIVFTSRAASHMAFAHMDKSQSI
jgi:hypothetical protein